MANKFQLKWIGCFQSTAFGALTKMLTIFLTAEKRIQKEEDKQVLGRNSKYKMKNHTVTLIFKKK